MGKRFGTVDTKKLISPEVIYEQTTSPSNPSSGQFKTYMKSDGKLYKKDSAGNESLVAAAGIPNYIASYDGSSTAGWAVYADAAASAPVDGTGGSANVAFTSNTTTPLRGSADFKLSKDAVNRQGQGVSYDFTIASIDQSKPMFITGEYRVTANYSYTNNDLVCYIYDVTNAVLIQPTPFVLDGSGKFRFEFQSNAGSTSYRLIFHVATTNASAWDFFFTNVVVSATPVPMTISTQDKQYDISSYLSSSPSISTIYRAVAVPYKTKNGTWRLKGNITYATTITSLGHNLTISGVTFYNTGSAGGGQGIVGIQGDISSGNPANVARTVDNTGQLTITFATARQYISFQFDVELASMPTWAVDYYPVQLGDGVETRVVAAKMQTSSSSISSSPSLVKFSSTVYDTHSGYNASTGLYTIQVAGYYKVTTQVRVNASSVSGQSTDLYIYLNGSKNTSTALGFTFGVSSIPIISTIIKCNVGDTISTYVDCSASSPYISAATDQTFLTIERISGPANVVAGEFVGAKYTTASGQTFGGNAIINFDTKEFDTHNAVTTGASWNFKAPVSGYYHVSGAAEPGSNVAMYAACRVNGVEKHYIVNDGAAGFFQRTFSDTYYLTAGDTLDIKAYFTGSLIANALPNFISIIKVNK